MGTLPAAGVPGRVTDESDTNAGRSSDPETVVDVAARYQVPAGRFTVERPKPMSLSEKPWKPPPAASAWPLTASTAHRWTPWNSADENTLTLVACVSVSAFCRLTCCGCAAVSVKLSAPLSL